ncbi:MAG: MATE family efflux transporter [Lachnospiraceae bacterium]|nr:MATE family efflux transporter [Lachnospiraceae bacterium]
MEQTYMKEKGVLYLVLTMSLPMVLSMMVNSLYNIIDSYFVAKISEDAMTALSLVYPLQNLINAATIGFGVGINAVIAYFLGAQEYKKADQAATQGTLLNALHGLVLMIVCIAVIPSFLGLFTTDAVTIDMGVRYSRIVFGFAVIISLDLSFEKVFQAVGKMTVSMVSMLCGCIANIILDPVLIFGLGPFPALGIEGAAIATGLGQVLTLVLYLCYYVLRPIPVKLCLSCLKPDREVVRRLYAVGISASLTLSLPSLMISCLNVILSGFSQAYVLVLGVYYKLQTFLYLTANGIVQGIRPLIGYNYGARMYDRVKKIYRTSLYLIAAIMALGTVLCLVFPAPLMGLFTDSPDTVSAGASALRIICIGFAVSSVSVTTCGALEGLGMGKPSLIISLCRYLLIMLPAAYLLSRILGASGVWFGFPAAEFLTAGISGILFQRAVRFENNKREE